MSDIPGASVYSGLPQVSLQLLTTADTSMSRVLFLVRLLEVCRLAELGLRITRDNILDMAANERDVEKILAMPVSSLECNIQVQGRTKEGDVG